jgi:hypothetical protein
MEELRAKKFWANVDVSGKDICWNYLLQAQTDGYGRSSFKGKSRMTHRIAFQLHHNREIEAGKILLHSCDNRKCCNPHHLREGTHKDNSDDKFSKGRFKVMKGEANGNSKLTMMIANEIRTKYATGDYTQIALAKEYNINQHSISSVVRNKRWIEKNIRSIDEP